MAICEIITLPHPTLRRKARKVTDFGAEVQTLIDDMLETMREAPGVGLAAPQVNSQLRVIVVEFGDEEDPEVPEKLYVVINPEINRFSKDVVTGTEGCLSIPGVLGDVERPQVVTVKGLNRQGKPFKIKAEGWLARIFQHEIDHLDGILFVDRAENVWMSDEKTTQIAAAK
ncbi:MAG TPA: peptide deformylase [Anaerolineales bacterium]|nr:peptide deformylase [Anaerolineales bacterium]